MKKLKLLLLSTTLVVAFCLASCGAKETNAKEEAKSECCEKEDTVACCEKKDSCSTPCDSTKKAEGEHKDCGHKH